MPSGSRICAPGYGLGDLRRLRKADHIDARLLQHSRPPYTRLLDLERKLRCNSCGNRQGNTLSVSMAPRD
jgi:hypothetical protein